MTCFSSYVTSPGFPLASGALSLQQPKAGFQFPVAAWGRARAMIAQILATRPPGAVASDKAVARQLCRNEFPHRDKK